MKVLEYDDDCKVWGVFCESDLESEYSHGHFVDNYPTEAEAIEAWNTRAKRTCRIVMDGPLGKCSACGDKCFGDAHAARYCPNCGAEVVSE